MVDVKTAAEALGIGLSRAYANARTGAIAPGVPCLRLGERLLRVPTEQLRRALGLEDGEQLPVLPLPPAIRNQQRPRVGASKADAQTRGGSHTPRRKGTEWQALQQRRRRQHPPHALAEALRLHLASQEST